jgi:SagB-type dehydrogenase family enzyme
MIDDTVPRTGSRPVSRAIPRAASRPAELSSVDVAWEIFHENSKTNHMPGVLPDQVVAARMDALQESLSYRGYPVFELPPRTQLTGVSVQDTLDRRETGRELADCVITRDDLSAILHYAYGVRQNQPDGDYPRPFRSVPSGGALYPLELYVHASAVQGLPVGLFHYEPPAHRLRLLRKDPGATFCGALVTPEIIQRAAITIFITAIFYRSTFKYGDRGYRFVLLEAGHVGQNIDLSAAALGLAAVNIGGYFDESIDRYLGLDGLRQSAVYLAAVGGRLTQLGTPHE